MKLLQCPLQGDYKLAITFALLSKAVSYENLLLSDTRRRICPLFYLFYSYIFSIPLVVSGCYARCHRKNHR